jgi:hypothetical protein
MTSEPPPRQSHEPIFDRGWTSPGSRAESRSAMLPLDPDQLAVERAARRGLHPPQATVRRVV